MRKKFNSFLAALLSFIMLISSMACIPVYAAETDISSYSAAADENENTSEIVADVITSGQASELPPVESETEPNTEDDVTETSSEGTDTSPKTTDDTEGIQETTTENTAQEITTENTAEDKSESDAENIPALTAYGVSSPENLNDTQWKGIFDDLLNSECVSYNINFYVDDQLWAVGTVAKTDEEDKVSIPPTTPPVKGNGSVFIEWRVNHVNGASLDYSSEVVSDMNLYAYYSEPKNRVYVNADGNSSNDGFSEAEPVKYIDEALTIANDLHTKYNYDVEIYLCGTKPITVSSSKVFLDFYGDYTIIYNKVHNSFAECALDFSQNRATVDTIADMKIENLAIPDGFSVSDYTFAAVKINNFGTDKLIEDCYFENFSRGIYVEATQNVYYCNIAITACSFTACGSGIFASAGFDVNDTVYNDYRGVIAEVTECYFTDCTNGIDTTSALCDVNLVQNVDLCNFTGNEKGISLSQEANIGEITDTNSFTQNEYGIYNDDSTIGSLSGDFSNNKYGVYNDNGTINEMIDANFHDNTDSGIYNTYTINQISSSEFSGSKYGIHNKGFIGMIDDSSLENNTDSGIKNYGTINQISGSHFVNNFHGIYTDVLTSTSIINNIESCDFSSANTDIDINSGAKAAKVDSIQDCTFSGFYYGIESNGILGSISRSDFNGSNESNGYGLQIDSQPPEETPPIIKSMTTSGYKYGICCVASNIILEPDGNEINITDGVYLLNLFDDHPHIILNKSLSGITSDIPLSITEGTEPDCPTTVVKSSASYKVTADDMSKFSQLHGDNYCLKYNSGDSPYIELVRQYSVTFYKNDGTETVFDRQPGGSEGFDLPSSNPTRTGYRFAGWYYDTAFAREVVAENNNHVSYAVTEDLSIYAKWTAEPVLSITKTVDKSTARSGDTLIYTITVTNNGGDAKNVKVEDVLPSQLNYISDNSSGKHTNGVVTWTLDTLAEHSSKVITLTTTIK